MTSIYSPSRRRRHLVLTSEHAGHPFRRSLPPHVTRGMPVAEPEVLAAEAHRSGWFAADDVRMTLSTFVAGFCAFSVMLT